MITPNSWGTRRFREANSCHHPAGSPKGGQFCSKPAKVHAASIGLNEYDQSSVETAERNGWTLTLMKQEKGWRGVDYKFAIEPTTVPAHVERRGRDLVDTEIATFDEAGRPTLKAGWHAQIPATPEPGTIFRGMHGDEWAAAQKAGHIKSAETHNLGDAQVGLTYFSTDPTQAQSYANGFAPWQFKPTFGRHAYVVQTRDPGTAPEALAGKQTDERGIPGGVAMSEVLAVYEARPYRIRPGWVEYYTDQRGQLAEGSRSTPDVFVAWRRIDLPLREANSCHHPAGSPKGGQFCSTPAKSFDDRVDAFYVELNTLGFTNPFNEREFVLGDDASVEIKPFDGALRIASIRSLAPGTGAGTRAMKRLMQLADTHGLSLTGNAKAFGTWQEKRLSTAQLKKWYAKLGFAVSKTGEIRYPK